MMALALSSLLAAPLTELMAYFSTELVASSLHSSPGAQLS